jgi:predicted kinase
MLIVFAGLPASGKTTLARELARANQARSAEISKRSAEITGTSRRGARLVPLRPGPAYWQVQFAL